MKRVTVAAGLGVLALISAVRAAGESPPPPGLPAPEHLTAETRAELRARMGRHGETMSNLVRAVVLLDRPAIRTLAGRIADEELVAQSRTSARDKRRMQLPPEFFTQQTALSAAARDLAAAAGEARDDRALADRFAALTRTCVSCHAVYLHGSP